MGWVLARRIVAVMQRELLKINSGCQKVGHSVRCVFLAIRAERSVASVPPSGMWRRSYKVALPRPAFVRPALVNVAPESVRLFWSELRQWFKSSHRFHFNQFVKERNVWLLL
jgi:hypothetical protein